MSTNFLSKNTILSRTDFLNKSLALTSYDNLTIKKVKLRLSLEDMISRSNNLSEKSILPKATAFSLIYLLWSIFPAVKAFKNKTAKRNDFHSKEDLFVITIEITDKNQINALLSHLFQEGNFLEKNLNADKLGKISNQEKKFSYNTKIKLGHFFQLLDFFNSNSQSYALDQIVMSVNLIPHFVSNKQKWEIKDILPYELQFNS